MKNGIPILFLLATFALSSCSKDAPVSEEEQDILLTVNFETDDLKTKVDDKTIENRFIAAYSIQGNDTVCTGIAYDKNESSVLKIKAKKGKMLFVAIANANETTDLARIIANENYTLPGYNALKGLESII